MGLPAIMAFPDMIVLAATVYLAIIPILISLLTQEGGDPTSTLERLIALTPITRYLRFFTQIFALKLGIEVITYGYQFLKEWQKESLSTELIIRSCVEVSFGGLLSIILLFFVPLILYNFDRFTRTLKQNLTFERS